MAIIPAEKYRIELIEANKSLHEHVWSFVEKSPERDNNVDVSTSTTDLTSLEKSAEFQKIMRQNMEEQANKTKMLIEDSIDLRIS